MSKTRKILISLCIVIMALCYLTLGLYSFGYMGFEDGVLHFYFNQSPDPFNEDPSEYYYTIHLRFPDGTTEDYTYNYVSGTFNPVNIISAYEEDNDCEFLAWYTDADREEELLLTDLRDDITIYASCLDVYSIRIHSATPGSSISTYTTIRIRENTIFNIDNYVTFTTSALYGIFSDVSLTSEMNPTFLVSGEDDIYLLWATPQANFTWILNGNNVTITGYNGTDTEIYIPSVIFDLGTNKTVTAIADSSFSSSVVNEINIPSSITTLEGAFDDCTTLTNIKVSEKSENYSTQDGILFSKDGTTLLKAPRALSGQYIIPETVASFEEEAFRDCLLLTSITLPSGVTSMPQGLFSNCSGLTSINIPEGIMSIGNSVFDGCTSLAAVYFPTTLTTIGDAAFLGCSSLVNIEIPDSVTTIGDAAFNSCTSLSKILFTSDTPASIGISVFSNGFYGFKIAVNGSVLDSYTTNWAAYVDNIEVESYFDEYNVKYSWYGDVWECTQDQTPTSLPGEYTILSSIDGVTVTTIGVEAFYNCYLMTNIIIPSSCINFKENVLGGDYLTRGQYGYSGTFKGCSNLQSIILPDGITVISGEMFSGCTALQSIYIPDSVVRIDAYAFYNCLNLQNLDISNISGATLWYGFLNNTLSLTNITIPASTNLIIPNSISQNYKLKYIVCLSSDTDILSGVGTNNAEGTSLIFFVPDDSLDSYKSIYTSIADNFYSVTDMSNFLYTDGSGVQYFLYGDDYELLSAPVTLSGEYTIPNEINGHSVTSIGGGAFYNCKNLNTLNIPGDTLVALGDSAFTDCTSLSQINVKGILYEDYKLASNWDAQTGRLSYLETDQSYFTWSITGLEAKIT